MTGSQNEKYALQYMRLFSLLQKAYTDKFLLETIDKYSKELNSRMTEIDTRTYSVLVYLCELIKKDLCLIIWKICCDCDKKANTLMSLGRLLNSITHIHYKTKLSKELRKYKDTIEKLRSKWLAHNDMEPANSSIELEVLYSILEELRRILNSLCDKNINSSVVPLSDFELISLKFRCNIGLEKILYHDNQPVVLLTNSDGNDYMKLEQEIR